jgi:hypothetical protein
VQETKAEMCSHLVQLNAHTVIVSILLLLEKLFHCVSQTGLVELEESRRLSLFMQLARIMIVLALRDHTAIQTDSCQLPGT